MGAARRARRRRRGRRAAGRVQPAGADLVPAAVAAGGAGRGRLRRRTATCCVPSCGTPAGCGSTTSWGCSGCGGCRRGVPPAEGTYVRYDHEALVGILALEAHRAGACVVGEDLGTVEPWVRDVLRERGILGTSVLWFERGQSGEPLAPEHWRRLCLATVTTHDLPPTAGYLRGEHLRIRAGLGLLVRPEDEERARDEADRAAWADALRARGLLREGADERETVEALHRYVAATPARLLGVALTDAVGDVRAQNQPGTDRQYPNWLLPLADGDGRPVLLEELAGLRAGQVAGPVGARRLIRYGDRREELRPCPDRRGGRAVDVRRGHRRPRRPGVRGRPRHRVRRRPRPHRQPDDRDLRGHPAAGDPRRSTPWCTGSPAGAGRATRPASRGRPSPRCSATRRRRRRRRSRPRTRGDGAATRRRRRAARVVSGDQVFTDREREDVERARRIAEAGHRPALLGLRRGARRRLARDGDAACSSGCRSRRPRCCSRSTPASAGSRS